MKEIATENFHRTKQDFPRSDVVPLADLGLLRLHYRDENYEAVANQYAKINSSSAPDSVKYHAYYYMGETHLRQGAYNKAIELFDLIPGDHPEYPFAQHSLAIASISADNPERAVQALDNVIQLTPKTKAQEEIINRSFVFIGYIYYEGIGTEKAPGKAVSALRKVSPNSYYYEDALLGIAWTALKASQWADCIEASKKLASVTKRDVIKAEAGLLEGYCYLLDKSYDAAVDVLRSASQTINNVQAPSEEEKNKAKMEYENDRGIYYDIGSMANNLALTSQSAIVVSQIDSLRPSQEEYESKLRSYYVFTDEFVRNSFFARNTQNVFDDVEYALARAENMAASEKSIDVIDRAKEKGREIDDEMQKLEEQLLKLQDDGEEVEKEKEVEEEE
jgi:tetratricopeptide (TPR) repeat protein